MFKRYCIRGFVFSLHMLWIFYVICSLLFPSFALLFSFYFWFLSCFSHCYAFFYFCGAYHCILSFPFLPFLSFILFLYFKLKRSLNFHNQLIFPPLSLGHSFLNHDDSHDEEFRFYSTISCPICNFISNVFFTSGAYLITSRTCMQ